MSEEESNYIDLKTALRAVEQHLRGVIYDPEASDWLKQAIIGLWRRDADDSLHDLNVLINFIEIKRKSDILMAMDKNN